MKAKAIIVACLLLCIFAACTTTDDAPKTYISKANPVNDYAYSYVDTVAAETALPVNTSPKIEMENFCDEIISDEPIKDSDLPPPLGLLANKPSAIQKMVDYIVKENTNVFTVDIATGNQLVCAKGTKITVPANAFVYANGAEVKDPVLLSVGEFLSKADFIMAGLTSMSGEEMIESSGMFFISAEAKGKQVQLKPDKRITIELADTAGVYSDTRIFTSNSAIANVPPTNWTPTNLFSKNTMQQQAITTRFLDMEAHKIIAPTTTGKKFKPTDREYLPGVTLYVINMDNDSANTRFFFDVRYKKTAYFSFIKQPFIKEKAYEPILTMADWDTLKIVTTIDDKGRMVDINCEAKSLTGDNAQKLNKILMPNKGFKMIKQRHTETTDYVVTAVKVSNAALQAAAPKNQFEVSALSWINCDRFLNSGKELITMTLDQKTDTGYQYYCVFKNINSVMPAYYVQGYWGFPNVPKNEEVVIVGVKNGKDLPGLFTANTKICGTVKVGEFIPYTPEAMKNELDNRLSAKQTEEVSKK
ncbi:MAG: hypothetical protein M0D57_15925 [Sphingobacteriales bacterium JAD_PAG50586_3]|nr:MAG: hypothetical protein M0D57_15925 [Sphingobacteriales bacterium JAD_PAG50586_3]